MKIQTSPIFSIVTLLIAFLLNYYALYIYSGVRCGLLVDMIFFFDVYILPLIYYPLILNLLWKFM